jgi:UDP:flavonoid glycosyltransferase YjiC (YdhE family)
MLPLAEGLARRGHRVFVALRDLVGAATVFGKAGVHFLQAPSKSAGRMYFRPTFNLSHILANIGWGNERELFGLACAWRNLLRLVDPDLVIFDYSPTALLAARCLPDVRKVVTGLGFFCPPAVHPFPPLLPGYDQERLLVDEARLLEGVNRLLRAWKQAPLDSLGQLFGEVDETILATFPELDHYPDRPATSRYWGHVPSSSGKKPEWPRGPGKRLYAYLKPCRALPDLLGVLRDRGDPTLVLTDRIEAKSRRRFESPSLQFETDRLDMQQVAAECDAAIHNANHGTLATLLLGGKPMLQLPITLEQRVLSGAVCRLGAGEVAPTHEPGKSAEIAAALDSVITDERYTTAARGFQSRYARFDPAVQRQQMLELVEAMLPAAKAPGRLSGRPIREPQRRKLVGGAGVTGIPSPRRTLPAPTTVLAGGGQAILRSLGCLVRPGAPTA